MVQQDPENISLDEFAFFSRLDDDEQFQRMALLGTLKLFTSIEDVLAE